MRRAVVDACTVRDENVRLQWISFFFLLLELSERNSLIGHSSSSIR